MMLLRLAIPFLLVAGAAPGAAGQLVWSQDADGISIVPSVVFDVPYASDLEAADDFELFGTVERILVSGYHSFGCSAVLAGVWVRFYENAAGVPGALQYEEFVAEGSPLLQHVDCPFGLDIVLPRAFTATGAHFVSVQLAGATAIGWSWMSANTSNPVGARMHWRDNLAGGVWSTSVQGQPKDCDLAFDLYGQGPPAPPPTEALWSQSKTFLGDQVPAGVWPGSPGSPGADLEAADDFELVASIERVELGGEICFGCITPTEVTGAWVRFYAAAGNVPGALQYEAFVPYGSPEFQCSCWQSVSITLAQPFQANGHHFVAFQLAAARPHDFGWSEAHEGAPVLATLTVRDRLAGGPWGPAPVAPASDLAFTLFGRDLTPPPTLEPDPCGDWEEVPTPWIGGMGDAHQGLRGVAVVAPDDVWAVGSSDMGPKALHWDGAAWQSFPVPAPSVSPSHVPSLEDVEAAATDDVWAAGSQWAFDAAGFPKPHAFVVRWDGTTWTEVPIPGLLGSVYGIEVVAADDVWFVGTTVRNGTGCNQAMTLHWDGSGLTALQTPCPDLGCEVGALGGYALEKASALASDDIWAVGGGHGPYHAACSYVVRYDGTSWNLVPSPEPGFVRRLYDVHALAPDDVWAVGDYLDGLGYHPYAIHWDGAGWTLEDLPGGGASVHAFAADDVYTVGGGVFHYDGTSWTWVDDLGSISGQTLTPSLVDLDGTTSCGLWGVGAKSDFSVGQVPFAARQDALITSTQLREPCGVPAPPGSIALVDPPRLGGTFAVAIDDPTGSAGLVPGGAVTAWAVALAPAPGHPCGVVAGSWGELLIQLSPPPIRMGLVGPWQGPGQANLHTAAVPADPTLAGVQVFTQGLFLDPSGVRRLTAALDAVLGY